MSETIVKTTCCIAGGGPAGMMLGFLLARAGVPVMVLEKHADFFRDFRGDTVHPSTLELIYELGLLDEFLRLPHEKIDHIAGQIGAERVTIADFSHLPTHCQFIALMPQWDFLNFIADHGRRYPSFRLLMKSEVTDLIEEQGKVVGLRAKTVDGALNICADLVVGCDGRHSTIRDRAGLEIRDIGAPIDVLWFRISRAASDSTETFGHIEAGRMMVMINRGDYWQCAFVGIDDVKQKGIAEFRDQVVAMSPSLRVRIDELKNWEDVKLLTVAVDRLREWHRNGLICIGDAAHAMSAVGGVGINLAVQDAVAAANILAEPLKAGRVTREHLEAVQRRRAMPTRVLQWIQVQIQDKVLVRALSSRQQPTVPLAVKFLRWFPLLQRIPARLVGMGIRPEHVRTPGAPSN
jgi:2-polyprenyl-6-methoxyphenol hydroxylase-like FAD-dependent oxidoreductase